jgi:enoyl-CoA hydratase/carnithine racemase
VSEPSSPLVAVEVSEGVMTLTLNRPDKLNAMTPALRGEWIAAIDRADADDSIRAVIVTGAGRAFCAGADISGGTTGFVPGRAPGGDASYRDGGGILALRLFEAKKPLIAAINGAAVGVGISATLPMDYRLASTSAKFGFVYTQRAIAPEACSSWFLPRLVGMQQALDWMLSGRLFDAEEALRGGLVSSLHSPESLMDEARRLARQIAAQTAPVSVAITRRLLWEMLAAPHPREAHRRETLAIPHLVGLSDAAEGIASFREKRAPRFTGRPSVEIPPELA